MPPKKPKTAADSVMPPTQAGAARAKARQESKADGTSANSENNSANSAASSGLIRDRIKELRRVPASELKANPKNWRTHPQEQRDALRGILAEVGMADAMIARETPEGLELIDGHLRADVTADQIVPVLVLDVTEAEAEKLLLSLDPLAAMAQADSQKLAELLDGVSTNSPELQAMYDDLATSVEPPQADTEIKQLEVRPPPPMSWVLIGLPTVRFGEIAESIERLASIPEIIIETTANDGGNITDGQ